MTFSCTSATRKSHRQTCSVHCKVSFGPSRQGHSWPPWRMRLLKTNLLATVEALKIDKNLLSIKRGLTL